MRTTNSQTSVRRTQTAISDTTMKKKVKGSKPLPLHHNPSWGSDPSLAPEKYNPLGKKLGLTREQLIEKGTCVVCQNEKFVNPEYPIGAHCQHLFRAAEARARRYGDPIQ